MKLHRLAKLYTRPKRLVYTPMPSIHEDLGGLSEIELEQELRVIAKRIEKGIIAPEGSNGLNYRMTRIQAQLKAVQKKK